MPAVPQNVSAEIAQGVVDALNVQAFSLAFEAARSWAPAVTAEELQFPVVLVVPSMRDVSYQTRRVKRNTVLIDVTIERALAGQSGELERQDELAAFAQEVEDFLSNPDNAISTEHLTAAPTAVSIDWDREVLLTERVFRTVVTVTYTLFR